MTGKQLVTIQPRHLNRIKLQLCKGPALYDIKLAGAAGFLRVDSIALSCCGQCAFFMKKGLPEFGRYGIPGPAIAKWLACLCLFAAGISGLDHKPANDTVKQH